ncbi:MAG: hypothetical protein GY861_00915 [bacterium]|nr:hypothetical protein [bacterium]
MGKDLHFDPNLILDFELEVQRRDMGKTWPKPGYSWKGPGTIDCLIEYMFEAEGEEEKPGLNIPDVPTDLLESKDKFIWYKYQTPYPTLLVDHFCQLMHTTPNYTPEQILVPHDSFQTMWTQLKPTLVQYLQVHFTQRPGLCNMDLLIRRCKAAIVVVAKMIQNKPQENLPALEHGIQTDLENVVQFH